MIRVIPPTLLLVCIAASCAIACNPYVPRVCEAFSRADSVFIGTLTKVEDIPTSRTSAVLAHFAVERVFKGKVDKEEVIKFGSGDCDPKLTDIGEKYFVYKMGYDNIPMFGNPTAKLNESSYDLKYADSVNWLKPVYEISGRLTGYDKAVLAKAVVTVEMGSFKQVLNVDKDNSYSVTVKQAGTYEIQITLPIEKRGWVNHQNSSMEFYGKTVEYSVDFKPNECDYREIEMLDWPQ
jgi:hypothetical protein